MSGYTLKTFEDICYFIFYNNLRCPPGGSPSGRNAQDSFTLHVQTPLLPGV